MSLLSSCTEIDFSALRKLSCLKVYSLVSELFAGKSLTYFPSSSIPVSWEEVVLTMSFIQENREKAKEPEKLHLIFIRLSDDDCL